MSAYECLQGLAMGILLGILVIPSISATKGHRNAVWGCRIAAIPVIVLALILTTKNFCEWTACGMAWGDGGVERGGDGGNARADAADVKD